MIEFFYHTQEKRERKLTEPIICTRDDAWLGSGYYFWMDERDAIFWDAPAIMFPYVRSFISTLTANLGRIIEPLVIPTQFFKGELEEIQFPDNSSSSVNQIE